MKVRCPSCGVVTQLELPIWLSVCVCGSLIRGNAKSESTEGRTTGANGPTEADFYVILGVAKSRCCPPLPKAKAMKSNRSITAE